MKINLPGIFLVIYNIMLNNKQLSTINGNRIIALGASAGSPLVIHEIISKLPDNFKIPILIILHIAPGFIEGMVDWMGRTTGKQIRLAKNGEDIIPGCIYFAPNGFNMGVNVHSQIILDENSNSSRFKPSVAYLFSSVAHIYGKNAVGIILSGMGTDGTKELLAMKKMVQQPLFRIRKAVLCMVCPVRQKDLERPRTSCLPNR